MDKTRGFYPLDAGSIPAGGTSIIMDYGCSAGCKPVALWLGEFDSLMVHKCGELLN